MGANVSQGKTKREMIEEKVMAMMANERPAPGEIRHRVDPPFHTEEEQMSFERRKGALDAARRG